jgi:hypothetical protein
MAKTKPTRLAGVDLIAAERARQISEEDYDDKHDDVHTDGSLAIAAACYAAGAANELIFVKSLWANGIGFNDPWPWGTTDDKRRYNGNALDPAKVRGLGRQGRLALLVKAGALIAAEIDRLQRKGKG